MRKVVIIGIGLVLIFVLVGGAYWLGKQGQKTLSTPTLTSPVTSGPTVKSASPTSAVSPTPVSKKGTIEGSFSFPSEGIPEGLKVCAENQDTKEVYCTDQHINDPKYTYGLGYILEVPAGTYFVYAMAPGDDYQAYYSEFVTCGLSVDCPSHEPISVEVKVGVTISDVDPQDWYNQSG